VLWCSVFGWVGMRGCLVVSCRRSVFVWFSMFLWLCFGFVMDRFRVFWCFLVYEEVV
jgi:hypothetical protein